MHPQVASYIDAAPVEQQSTLRELREMIVGSLPQAEETFGGRFPVYLVDGEWTAGFASRAKTAKLYIMRYGLVDAYADRLGRLVSGKSCIDYRPTKELPLDDLRALAQEVLVDLAARLAAEAG